jgi:hypothetical protein
LCDFSRTADGILRALDRSMNDDARNGDRTARPLPSRGTCPHCLNPHTVVAEERYRGVMRFCPMCDYSWVIGEAGEDDAAPKRGATRGDRGPA